jgi:hypothetical protein
MFLHPISANESKKNVAVNAPRLSLLAIDGFVSSLPFALRRLANSP